MRLPGVLRSVAVPALLAAFPVGWVGPVSAQDPTTAASQESIISGQVVDAGSGSPLGGVAVRIGADWRTQTNASGYFAVGDLPAGRHRIEFSHIGFGDHAQEVSVEPGEELSVTVRMSMEAIELEPFVVQGRSELEERRRSSGHGMNEIGYEEIQAAARAGLSLTDVLQTMPGTLADQTSRASTCVQYRAIRTGGRTACREVAVVLDGVMVASPGYVYQSLPLRDIERLEMLSPGQAGIRYGTGAGQAVLLIETRTGRQTQQTDASRFVTGFDWRNETQPYPWMKVMGSSFLVNALLVGTSLMLAEQCLWSPEVGSLGLRTRCNGFNTVAVGLLSVAVPAVVGGYVAGWGGQTDLTHGRLAPTALVGAMTLTGGYLLIVQGGDVGQTAGTVILAAGVPLALTLADRIFRVTR